MNFRTVIGAVAPWIGTALGGPLGGMAVDTLGKIFGLSDTSEESLKTALSGATPDQMLALKNADNDFKLKMQELGFKQITDLEKIAADDRDSARKREMTVRDLTPMMLAIGVTVGFFSVLGFMLVNGKPLSGGDALLVMLGALGGAWGSVISYYFGSSAGSAQKSDLLAGVRK
jgi:hypothetical protein